MQHSYKSTYHKTVCNLNCSNSASFHTLRRCLPGPTQEASTSGLASLGSLHTAAERLRQGRIKGGPRILQRDCIMGPARVLMSIHGPLAY